MKYWRYIFIFAMLCGLASCHTQKRATHANRRITVEQQVVQQVIEAQPFFQAVEATKVRVGITYAGQKMNINGSLANLTDSLLIFSVQPLLGIEMFRVELTPEQILVIDKMNRRFVPLTYAELAGQVGLPLTFTDLQALFLNRMFVVGKEQSEIVRLPFTHTATDEEHRLKVRNQMLNYTFGIVPQTYALISTEVALGKASGKVEYLNHQLHDNVYFPNTFLFRINDGKDNIIECDLTLLKVQFNQPLKMRRADLSRYTETTLNKILSR